MISKRLISMFSAFVLMLSLFTLLPEGALRAYAEYSGTGTKTDPYIVTTYEDLEKLTHTAKYHDWTGVRYITLGDDIISMYDDKNSYNFGITGDCSVILDLAGHTIKRVSSTMDKGMFTVTSGASLTIKDSVGTGYVHCGLMHTVNNPDCFRVLAGGTLTIEAGTFYNSNGKVINQVAGTANILGGSFSNIYSHVLQSSAGKLLIDGGEFTCTKQYTPIYIFTHDYEIRKCVINGTGTTLFDSTTSLADHIPAGTKVKVDNSEVTLSGTYTSLKGTKALIGKFSNVTKANITLSTLKAGAEFPYIISYSTDVKVLSMDWHHSGETEYVTEGETAVAGSTYDMYATLIPANDFLKFANPTVTVNGTEPCTVYTGGDSIIVKYTVTVPFIKVTDVLVNINKPVAGENIGSRSNSYGYSSNVLVRTRDGARYRNKFFWHDGSNYLSDSAVFEGGKYYYAYVKFKAAANYELSENMNVMVQGVKADKVSLTTDEYGQKWALYSAKFYCDFSGEQYQMGDVNHDSSVDRIDANLLSRYVAGWDGYEDKIFSDVADLNGDGEINRIDANILSRCVADWDGYRERYIK